MKIMTFLKATTTIANAKKAFNDRIKGNGNLQRTTKNNPKLLGRWPVYGCCWIFSFILA
jgi:hypothetical protein